MAETKIEPALSADQWGILKRIHWLSVDDNDVQIDKRDLVIVSPSYHVAAFRDGIPALIALANAALPDGGVEGNPGKITRDGLKVMRMAGDRLGWPSLGWFADGLVQYLPPEG